MKLILNFSLLFFSLNVLANEPTNLKKLAWMSGNWQGEDKGHQIELNLSGVEGGIIIGGFKKLTPSNDLRFARFMNFRETPDGNVILRLFPFFQPRNDYYTAIELTDNKAVFHRIYPSDSGCNISKPEDALNDSGDLLQCDRHPIRITYEQLPDGSFQESYTGYQYYEGKHHNVSFVRKYKKL